MRTRLLRLLLAVCAASLLGADCRSSEPAIPSAPAFRLETLGHGRFYLHETRSSVVVLSFWRTDCTACKRELVELEGLAKGFGAQGLQLASICTDPENQDSVRRIVRELGLRQPVLLDKGGAVAQTYNVGSYPTTVIIDREGGLRRSFVGWGEGDVERLGRTLETLLADDEPE